MSLRVEIEHRYRNGGAISAAFEGQAPGVVALFGASGSGKTSVMNAIAGLLRTKYLKLDLNGQELHKLPPEQRRIGYVFQEGRLFPHRTVRANLMYGLMRAPPGQITWDEVVMLLGLGLLLNRYPHTLSGGERQRVAIGRALLSQPRLLLMDEPLASLDQPRRDEILPYLKRLRTAFAVPIIYASHSMDEVTRLADRVVLMENGRQVAEGPLTELASQIGLPLAMRDDAVGVLRGRVHAHMPERRLTGVACGANVIWVPMVVADIGAEVRLRIAAREVILATGETRSISVTNSLEARIIELLPLDGGASCLVQLDLEGGGQLLSRITMDAVQRLGLRHNVTVLALIKAVSVEFLAERLTLVRPA
jgi:molybdate transport system ATP-binding protein